MDSLVSLRNGETPTGVIVSISEVYDNLTVDEQYWVNYRSCRGIRFAEDGEVERMTVGQCAAILGVSDTTLRNWERRIERFQELVAYRRKVLYSDKVVSSAWAATALKARTGDDAAVERILTNFDPNYKSPKQTHELDVGDNMIELFAMMRKEAQVIDGEFTEADPGAGAVASEELPANLPEQP